MVYIVCHWHLPSWNNGRGHLPSSSKKGEETCDIRNPVDVALNGGKEGDEGKTSRWNPLQVEASLSAKDPWALKSTFPSESALGYGGKEEEIEELWQELFSNPTAWRDHRSNKPNPRFPDFKHTTHTRKALWLDSKWMPRWVEAKLATKSWESNFFADGDLGYGGKKAVVEGLWRELFSDPTEWRDHRSDKINERFPDFKHTTHTDKALWLDSKWIPPWVKERLVALPPGSVPLSTFSRKKQLSRYAQAGQYEKTIELFEQMQRDGDTPDRLTFVTVLKACSSSGLLEHGRHIHTTMQPSFEADVFIGTCLVDMYAKCGSIQEAEMVFNQMRTRDVVTFNAMISGYVKCGEGQRALQLFEQMQGQGVDSDPVTFVGVINACASLAAIEGGRQAHEEIVRRGYESEVTVGNCLVDMYAKCGSIEEAELVFNAMPTRNVVTFNAMIGGYVKCGEEQKALELFQQMQVQGVEPEPVTFVGVLNACASLAAIEGGRHAHEEIIRRVYELDIILGTCLVDMYAKCGSIEEAEMVFNQMPTRDVVTWNAMLAGYGIHGYARSALETFTEMCAVVKVNSVTFLSLLSACSHGGLVADGLKYFKSMSSDYNISPTVEHFACVVDLLGRAGHFGEAVDLIMSMPIDPNVSVWMALLGACRAHVNVEVGELCAKQVLELDPDNAAAYIVLSNIYAAASNFGSGAKLHGGRLDRGVKKIPVCTWIEVNTEVHSFVVDDCSHPHIEEICAELDRLSSKMKDCGYVQETRLLWCVNKKEKNFHLCCHGEKLTIAFGLISTAPGTPLLIQKNLRLCRDCHFAIQFISKIVGRVITVKDGNQFHHFQHGLCSCRDYS